MKVGLCKIRGRVFTAPEPSNQQFILQFRGDEEDTVTELAFLDARRLGRIKLCASPTTEPPISTLGFDPILSMPGLEEFAKAVRKRTCPIKALLLDQSFSAGVGNWVAGKNDQQASTTFSDVTRRQMRYCTIREYIPSIGVIPCRTRM